VKAKPFFLLFFAGALALGALSLYMHMTAPIVEHGLATTLSPDKKFKAVRVTLASEGPPPFCIDTIAVMLAVYPDEFAEQNKAYQVFTSPCETPDKRANLPRVEWQGDRTLNVIYSAKAPGYDEAKANKKHFDITNSVKVTFQKAD
jgi:hypothetical protein